MKKKKEKHKNDELKNFIFKFLENTKIQYEGNQENEIKNLNQFFDAGIILLDHPDGFCKCGDNVLIIEHFEFDSSAKNKDGSKNRQEIFRTSNVKTNDTDPIQIYRDEIKCDYTIENYVNNAKYYFYDHYNKINDYKIDLQNKNIITTNTNVEVLFCIEDTTALGNIDENGKPLILLHCIDFIEAIKNCSELNYIVCGSSFGSNNFTWFTSINNIENYRDSKHKYTISNTTIANLTPHVMTSFFQI